MGSCEPLAIDINPNPVDQTLFLKAVLKYADNLTILPLTLMARSVLGDSLVTLPIWIFPLKLAGLEMAFT